jgi:hypothetical protein
VLVEDIDHPIAEAPQQEEGRDQYKGNGKVLAVCCAKQTTFASPTNCGS